MEWMQRRMRRHVVDDQDEPDVPPLRSEPAPPAEMGDRTLELVELAVEHLRQTEQTSAERHARAEMLSRRTIEQVSVAEERVRTSEMALRAAQTQVERGALQAQQLELEIARAAMELAAARNETAAAESHARDAERRAAEAEAAVKKVEAAMRRILSERGVAVGAAA